MSTGMAGWIDRMLASNGERAMGMKSRVAQTKFVLFGLVGLCACSQAGFEGYGPLGEGFVGSAYGYTDRQIGAGVWQVEYVGADSAEARQGAIRRANELCQQNGFGAADFTPSVAPRVDLIVASGTSRCLPAGQGFVSTGHTSADRIAEIDAEIAALRIELVTSQAPGSRTGMGTLDILAAGMNQVSTSSINRQIAALEAERAALLR